MIMQFRKTLNRTEIQITATIKAIAVELENI